MGRTVRFPRWHCDFASDLSDITSVPRSQWVIPVVTEGSLEVVALLAPSSSSRNLDAGWLDSAVPKARRNGSTQRHVFEAGKFEARQGRRKEASQPSMIQGEATAATSIPPIIACRHALCSFGNMARCGQLWHVPFCLFFCLGLLCHPGHRRRGTSSPSFSPMILSSDCGRPASWRSRPDKPTIIGRVHSRVPSQSYSDLSLKSSTGQRSPAPIRSPILAGPFGIPIPTKLTSQGLGLLVGRPVLSNTSEG